jgi:hypothetical protein
MFGFQRIKEGVYTPGEIDQRWSDDVEKALEVAERSHRQAARAARADPGAAEGAHVVGDLI